MYKIKSTPKDFIVKEIPKSHLSAKGQYTICLLKKTNYTTIRAIEQISRSLNTPLKNIGFAGTKDKNAITYQFISIKNTNFEKITILHLNDIELDFIGYSNSPLSLGDLKGNEFIITIKDIEENQLIQLGTKLNSKQFMPNLFGEQRFSKNNKEIGKCLLKSEFKQAIDLIIDSNSDYKEKIQSFLKTNKNNFTAALHIIPKKLLRLYLHSYQSHIWNKVVKEYLQTNKENIQIPIIGFGTELENKDIAKITLTIMKEENITFRDFINRKIPELSSEGDNRQALIEIQDLKILEKEKDTIKINFKLSKGCYATEAIKFLLNTKT